MTVLTKKEFVKLVAEQLETSSVKASETLDAVWAALEIATIEEKAGVKLGNVGTLKVEVVPERDHRNPSTGETITKPEHYAVKFKANAAFKKELAEVELEA